MNSKLISKLLKGDSSECLGEDVRGLFTGRNPMQDRVTVVDGIADEMHPHPDVLRARVVDLVAGELNGGLVIFAKNGRLQLRYAQVGQKLPQVHDFLGDEGAGAVFRLTRRKGAKGL